MNGLSSFENNTEVAIKLLISCKYDLDKALFHLKRSLDEGLIDKRNYENVRLCVVGNFLESEEHFHKSLGKV